MNSQAGARGGGATWAGLSGEDALARRWTLTPADAAEVLRARGSEHRLRCAVQLCTLRATGRFAADYRRAPPEAVNHLAAQLGLDPVLFLPEPERPATESVQLARIRRHLGWHEFDGTAEQRLRGRLQEHAAEGMTPGPLLALAGDLLRAARVVAPAPSTLERLVGSVTAHAVQDLFERIAAGLPERLRDAIEDLVDVPEDARGLSRNLFATIHDGELRLRRDDALPISPGLRKLRAVIGASLPQIRVEDMLRQVDRWTGLTRALTPLGGYEPRTTGEDAYRTLLAALIAHGTNLGVAAMSGSIEGMTPDRLHHTSQWFLREATLKTASKAVVDHHHLLPFSATWGDGTMSSSDGQRFAVQRDGLLGAVYPRYFGYYDRAITLYTHLSDQFGVFATQAISCAPREAGYVLDGLLENDTLVRPKVHTTDTHGFTEQLFGLCHLLGIAFMPRLKDLPDQHLYKLDKSTDYGPIEPLFRGVADAALIAEQWDQLVRIAASLKDRTAPAHVVLQRLINASPADRVSKALTALGRVCKTLFVLRYVHEEPTRLAIQRQLNRGEARHALARWLFFANRGEFRVGDYEEVMNKASCLGLLSNAAVLWNTVQIERVVGRLRAGAAEIDPADLAHVWPLQHARIIPNGTYFLGWPQGEAVGIAAG